MKIWYVRLFISSAIKSKDIHDPSDMFQLLDCHSMASVYVKHTANNALDVLELFQISS